MTTTSEQFEEKLLGVLSGETQSEPEGPHLRAREFRRLLRGRMRVGEFDRLGAHLASCVECRARYDQARKVVGVAPHTTRDVRSASWIGAVLLRHVGVIAVVLSIVAISIALDAPPRSTPSGQPGATPLARGAAAEPPASPRATLPTLDAQSLVRALHTFDGYPPSRAAAYTIGLLRQYGVPLSSSALAFAAATIFVAEPGDSWESVAAKSLGDPALWPMIVLLNLELTKDGEFVPAGTYLRVPKTLPLGEST